MSEKKELKSLGAKLLEVQSRVGAIKKDSVNPHFKNRYFDINTLLAEIKPLLTEIGLVINQPLVTWDQRNAIETIVLDTESGETLTSRAFLPNIEDPQKIGSAITYFRRYALQSLFALEAEDDDANVASGKAEPQKFTRKAVNDDEPPF